MEEALRQPRIRTVLHECSRFRVGSLLDVGCGDGIVTAKLASCVSASQVFGVELSDTGAATARARGIRVVVNDLRHGNLPFSSGTFDMVFAGGIIEHISDSDRFVDELFRVLKPNGHLVLTCLNIASWYSRAQLLLGFQPYGIPASNIAPVGMIFRSGRQRFPQFLCQGYGATSARAGDTMVRFFTTRGLVGLLRLHHFQIHRITGTRTVPIFGLGPVSAAAVGALQRLFSRVPSMAESVVVIASAVGS